VLADPVMLEQIFFNLLENAVRYSPAGSPVIIVADVEEEWLAVSVRDLGPGIPEEERSRAFERFFRGSASAGQDGSGLGLSIAHGFAQAFGGSIAIGGDSDGGAIVTVRLPLEKQDEFD
jgi:two-component system, OmpR family, sensor histidine kinase KdpD